MKRVFQWSLATALCLWAVFSFLVLAGEEAPDSPYTFGEFFMLKTAALINLVGCYYIGKWLHKKGLLPRELDEITKDEEI